MTVAALSCYLKVDVNGEETFMVDKGVLCIYSSKLSKLIGRFKSTTCQTQKLKVNFNDFPGGAKSFELLTRFCYNNANINLTPFNICLLHSAAGYMEMDKAIAGAENLVQQTDKFLKDISYWSWNELLAALKQCQDTLKPGTSSSSSLLQKCVEALVGRLASASEASSYLSSSSSDSSGVRFSCDSDTKSTDSSKNSSFRVTWWFENLAFLIPEVLQLFVRLMISQRVDNALISKFLFFYHKLKVAAAVAVDEKFKLTTSVIDMLYLLDWNLVSFKSLLRLLRIASSAKLEKLCSTKLESMIGSQLDQATLDDLLIPSSIGTKYLYNVNLVLRLLKAFVLRGYDDMSRIRLRNVASLVDKYMSEVAPDPSLRPSIMLALATALPDFARESYDGVYRAIDLYIEVHSRLSKEHKLKICSALNYDKLSLEASAHLAQNTKFPSKPAVEVLISQQLKLKSVLKNVNLQDFPHNFTSDVTKSIKDMSIKKARVHSAADKDNVTKDNQELKEDIYGMQWRVVELEKLCKNMQTQMSKIMKARPGSHNGGMRSLPKFCSSN